MARVSLYPAILELGSASGSGSAPAPAATAGPAGEAGERLLEEGEGGAFGARQI